MSSPHQSILSTPTTIILILICTITLVLSQSCSNVHVVCLVDESCPEGSVCSAGKCIKMDVSEDPLQDSIASIDLSGLTDSRSSSQDTPDSEESEDRTTTPEDVLEISDQNEESEPDLSQDPCLTQNCNSGEQCVAGVCIPDNTDQDGDSFSVNEDCDDNNATIFPGAMELCNGVDDDCDQLTDEGFDGDGDGFAPCGEDLTRFDCDDSHRQINPSAMELCNGTDDNCNEVIDESDPSVGTVCNQENDGIGICRAGVTQCRNGSLECDGAILPTRETCDNIDNDCNGVRDDNVPAESCETQCGAGLIRCESGVWRPCEGPLPTPETCDGADNNCDGQIDNGNLCNNSEICRNGRCEFDGWIFQAERDGFGHECGRAEGDGWSVATGDHSACVVLFGPYTQDIPSGNFTATFYVMIDNNTAGDDRVFRLDVAEFYNNDPHILREQNIRRRQFSAPFQYTPFGLPFSTGGNVQMEFRIYWYGTAYIRIDRVEITPR